MAEFEKNLPTAVTSDLHIGSPTEQRFTLDEWEAFFADFGRRSKVIGIAGDLSQAGKMSEADALARMFAKSKAKVLVILGNHDRRSPNLKRFKDVISEPKNVYLLDDMDYFLYQDGENGEELFHGFVGLLGIGGGFGSSVVTRGRGYNDTLYRSAMEQHAQALDRRIAQSPAARNTLVFHYPPHQSRRVLEWGYNVPSLEGTIDPWDKVERILHGHFHEDKAEHQTAGGKEVKNVSKDLLADTQPDGAPFVVIYARLSGLVHFPEPQTIYERVPA